MPERTLESGSKVSKDRAHTLGGQHLHFSVVRASAQVRRGFHASDLKTATAPATVQCSAAGRGVASVDPGLRARGGDRSLTLSVYAVCSDIFRSLIDR